MSPTNITAKALRTNRRWLPRFGLRALLLLVALFGCGFGYLGHLYRRVAHQRYIVAKIQEAGGEVRYNYESVKSFVRPRMGKDLFAYVVSVDFNRSSYPAEPFDPHLLLDLPELKSVLPVDVQVSDEWLKCISQIPRLSTLILSANTTATADASSLARLESAKSLEDLVLSGDWVTDKTVTGIANLKQLNHLWLAGPNISKQAAEELQKSLPHCLIVVQNDNDIFTFVPQGKK